MPVPKGKLQKKCVEFCCGGRLSITSLDSTDIDYEPDQMSCLTHAMAQARLDQMIKNQRQRRYAFKRGRIRRATTCDDVDYRCIMLVAMDKMSVDPVEDFRRSMFEVITSNGMDDPKTLRSLLSCYLSVNPRTHRSIILEVFHEIIMVRNTGRVHIRANYSPTAKDVVRARLQPFPEFAPTLEGHTCASCSCHANQPPKLVRCQAKTEQAHI